MTSKRRSLALSLLLLAGCGGSNLPAELDGLFVSDALVGGEGKIRVYLRNPASKAVDVELSVEGEAQATVPSVARIPFGAIQTEVAYTGVAPGSFVVRASIGDQSYSQNPTVVSELSIRGFRTSDSPPDTTTVGYLDLNARLPMPAEIALLSSDPAVATVPATVKVPAFASYVSFPITTHAKGISTLTATLGERSVTTDLSVADIHAGFQLYPDSGPVGTLVRLTLRLNPAPKVDVPVTFSSSNPAVFAPPASAKMPAGTEYFEFYSSIRGIGSSLVKATINGESFSVALIGSNQSGSIQVNSELNSVVGLEVGAVSNFNFYRSIPVETTITTASSTAGIVSIAPSYKWTEPYATIPVLGTAAGATTLTFSVDGHVFSKSFTVVPEASIFDARADFYSVDTPGTVTVMLNAVVAADTVVNLTQTGPGTLDLPASVRIPSGSSGISVSVKPMAPGAATVHVELRGVSKDAVLDILP